MLNPVWGTVFNFIFGLLGLAESTGLTNVLGSSGKAGAVTAMVIAFANAGLHGISSANAGPFVNSPPPPSAGMRTMGLFFLAILLLFSTTGHAADIAVKKTPQMYIDPWSPGVYVGADVGYGINIGRETFVNPAQDFGVEPGGKAQGFLGGLHAGYGGRLNNTNIYLGMESDVSISGANGGAGLGLAQTNDKVTWLTSTRGRAGYIFDKTLLYASAGWGWGGTEKSFALFTPGGGTTAMSATQNGFVWAAGVELALATNWFARLEYQQYMFGTTSASDGTVTYSAHENIAVIRGGLTYKF